MTTVAPSRIIRPRARRRPAARRARDHVADAAAIARLDEVIALVREVERRLEPRDQVEQRRVDRRDAPRQRAVELIERHARLERRRGVDQVGDRLGLHEIALAVQERAQRELAWLGQARAGLDRARTIACSTTGLPCALISTTCWPVYECGAGNQVATTSSSARWPHAIERRARA